MDEQLLAAFRSTDYRVCVDEGEWASIQVDQTLPPALQALVGTRTWGFITAWNPAARPRDEAANLAALRDMLDELRRWPGTLIREGIGVGRAGWREPSLFVTGPEPQMLDALARTHGQLAYVHGHGRSHARLRLLPP